MRLETESLFGSECDQKSGIPIGELFVRWAEIRPNMEIGGIKMIKNKENLDTKFLGAVERRNTTSGSAKRTMQHYDIET